MKHARRRWQILFFVVVFAVVVAIIGVAITRPNRASVNAVGTTIKKMRLTTTTVGIDYITTAQAINHLNQNETVRVNIAYTFTDSAGTEFLDQYANYASGFVVCIFASDLANFAGDPATAYRGSTIDVTGLITTYDGYIQILNPSKIRLVA